MCGFVGAFGADLRQRDVDAALDVISYRGPDGRELIAQGPLLLAACRLAIVPPYAASPIQRVGEDVLVLNGEVYDLPEADGLSPSTDTERLARTLARDSRRLDQLRGLFAFCYSTKDGLLLARDRFGIKPLYWTRIAGGVAFASEIKALLSLPGVSRMPDADVLASIDVVGFNVFIGRTPFASVAAVKPGHALTIRCSGAAEERRFAGIPQPATTDSTTDACALAETVEFLLSDAVGRCMRHDPHPKAIFFSGGLDSSLLLDIARHEGQLTAFVLSDSDDSDDLVEARQIAACLGVPLREVFVDDAMLARDIVHYAWHFEQPVIAGTYDLFGGVAFHTLARYVATEAKVALSGEGADELFLGYHRLHSQPELAIGSIQSRAARAQTSPPLLDWLASWSTGPGSRPALTLRQLAVEQGLSEYHLASVDRSGMAFGLEIRPPFLDEALVSAVAPLPEEALLDRRENWTKVPLRRVVRRRLSGPACGRVAIRRKRAMASAVEHVGSRLRERLHPAGISLDPLLRRLFFYLHVDPGFRTPPDASLLDLAHEGVLGSLST